MPVNNKSISFRIDETMLDKLHVIADYEGRSANGQVIYLIRKLIEQFEKEHGEIKIERHPKKETK